METLENGNVIGHTHWGYEWEVTPGLITGDCEEVWNVRQLFTAGQCHALALAIHEKTGWPLVAVWYSSMPEDINDYHDCPSHYMVQTPEGELLDITGTFEECDLDHRGWEYTTVDSNHADTWIGRSYLKPDMDIARQFVDSVVALTH